jgi:hypothetical protein
MDNGPISVSAPGVSLIGAQAKDITFSTRYPFAKLDTTNPVSFQVITIFLNSEPPNPGVVNTSVQTLIYSYPHGYKYVPSSWFLISLDNFQTVAAQEGGYIQGATSGAGTSNSTLIITVDATNVNIYVNKFWGSGSPGPIAIIGYFISIRAYIFAEGLLGDSVPIHA